MTDEYLFAAAATEPIAVKVTIYGNSGQVLKVGYCFDLNVALTAINGEAVSAGVLLVRQSVDPPLVRFYARLPAPKRQPRKARIESLGTVLVGWWLHKPVEGQTLKETMHRLAEQIGLDPGEFFMAANLGRGWITAPYLPNGLELTEILPDGAAPVCGDCKGTGKYVGFLEVRPCPTCRPSGGF